MAVDPFIGAALITLLGQGLGGAFAPEGQEVRSFADEGFSPNINPARMLEELKNMITRLGQSQGERAFGGVSLPSAFAQQPGVYTGGGLPMPIGLTASDPALTNPGLLSIPGMNNYDPFQSMGIIGTPWAPGTGQGNASFSAAEGTKGENFFAGGGDTVEPFSQSDTLSPFDQQSMRSTGAITDDLDQALGAIDLLMRGEMGALV